MLRRIYTSDIVQWAYEATQRNEYFVVGVPVNFYATGLERFVDLFVLTPE